MTTCVSASCAARLKGGLHRGPCEHEDREDPKDGSEWHTHRRGHSGSDKTEDIALPLGEAATRDEEADCERPRQGHPGAGNEHEEPAEQCRRGPVLRLSELVGEEYHRSSEQEMEDRETTHEALHSSDDVVEDGQE